MKLSFPITKKRIRNHFTYAWWQYVLLISVAIFGWNLIYTTTRYRSPEHLKVEWYCEGVTSTETDKMLNELMESVRLELFPDMEEVTFTSVAYDDQYGDMQLMVWSAAGQGDLYTLSKSRFESLALNGGMLELQPYIDDGTLNVDGIDLKNGYVTDPETGKKYLMGIPADTLTGLEQYGIACTGRVMSVLSAGGNTDNTLKLMQWLIDHMAN